MARGYRGKAPGHGIWGQRYTVRLNIVAKNIHETSIGYRRRPLRRVAVLHFEEDKLVPASAGGQSPFAHVGLAINICRATVGAVPLYFSLTYKLPPV